MNETNIWYNDVIKKQDPCFFSNFSIVIDSLFFLKNQKLVELYNDFTSIKTLKNSTKTLIFSIILNIFNLMMQR